ncbi:MAG: DUF924 domain-containing protein [Betaproteobacteria bacterium]|nr:DUF924 domain-containing protein [Betaproteobacteria bacterium]MBI2960906.1 DUF924 domain-containing protein [Betaproteobacteria bacterium]
MFDFAAILDFWFGAADSPERGRTRKCWFARDAVFDAQVRGRFQALHEAGCRGELALWERGPLAALALVVVLDQFPRNMFRGNARAFAADAIALAVARRMVEKGFDLLLRPVERAFVYLPFEHAEDLAVQRRSLALFAGLAGDAESTSTIDYARRHYEIIARFGRFPHRNAVLGRTSTEEEIAFFAQAGSSFQSRSDLHAAS